MDRRLKWIALLGTAALVAVLVLACALEAPAEVPKPTTGEVATVFSSIPENVDKYRTLLGLRQSKLESVFNEVPVSLHNEGVEFKSAQVRVWFDENHGRAVHVMILSRNVDFNGAHLGDRVEKFDDAFRDEVALSPEIGYKDYLYEEIVLRLYYDAASGKTEAAGLMVIEK
jgi:hypothetical protein